VKRKNSFDLIRLFAAGLVVVSHSFAMTGHTEPNLGGLSLGAVGVWIFFILSGYLIAKSWDQYPRFNVFFAKRILRIFPGLAVAVVVTIIVTGLFFTTLPFLQFLVHQNTLSYLNNILLYNPVFTLPGGVFATNAYPNAVNGSIWTLAYEFTMYIAVALIGVFKLYKKISPIGMWLIIFAILLAMTLIGRQYFALMVFNLDISQLFAFALMFFSGIVMYKEADRIKLQPIWGVVSIVGFIGLGLLFPTFLPFFASVLLAYGLFALGQLTWFSEVGRFGDFSYGIYIYSFPIQQAIATMTGTHSPLKMFALSLVLSFVAAFLSWHLVESKALKLKDKINLKKYPVVQADNAW
jgi:peptidoglycan/LPS O-acetylase OafA/YrhL